MINEKFFINKDGTLSTESVHYFNNILEYANRYNLKNTLMVL